jgi:hypothetical protein
MENHSNESSAPGETNVVAVENSKPGDGGNSGDPGGAGEQQPTTKKKLASFQITSVTDTRTSAHGLEAEDSGDEAEERAEESRDAESRLLSSNQSQTSFIPDVSHQISSFFLHRFETWNNYSRESILFLISLLCVFFFLTAYENFRLSSLIDVIVSPNCALDCGYEDFSLF